MSRRKWTDHEKKLITALYKAGESYGDIAEKVSTAFGVPTNRNQIAGMVNRIGSRRGASSSASPEERIKAAASVKAVAKAATKARAAAAAIVATRAQGRKFATPRVPPAEARAHMSARIAERMLAPDSVCIGIEELSFSKCSFITHLAGADTEYCGAPIVTDARVNPHRRPYCSFHLQITHRNLPPIKKGEEANAE